MPNEAPSGSKPTGVVTIRRMAKEEAFVNWCFRYWLILSMGRVLQCHGLTERWELRFGSSLINVASGQ